MALYAQAKSTFFGTLSGPNFDFVCQLKMVKETLDPLDDVDIGSLQAYMAKIEVLRHELKIFEMKANESYIEMFTRLTKNVNQLWILKAKI